ncbi:MAG: Ada metal-binding domain-containing protein [Burkholderiaceae bacterium]
MSENGQHWRAWRLSILRTCPAPPHPAQTLHRRRGRYLALRTRDARFDGQFFTGGVTSTGIYCRPVCAVRTPRRENCRFFALAAQAEAPVPALPALPPEVAPQALAWSVQDATSILVQQAVRLLDAGDAWGDGQGTTVAQLAAARWA